MPRHSRLAAFGAVMLLVGLVWAGDATAQATYGEITGAAQRAGDRARGILVLIFGNVVNNPLAVGGAGGDTVLASIFQVLNGGMLVIGGFVAVVMFVRKLMQTGHDGAVFDREHHSFWGPVRLLIGIAGLVPTANGWSLAQLVMLWGASLVGVGLGNLGVDRALTAFTNGASMVVQPAMPSTVNTAHSVFEVNLCMHAINSGIQQAREQGALVSDMGFVQQQPTARGFVLRNNSFVCGGADINSSLEPQPASTMWFTGTIDTSDLRAAHLQALQGMQGAMTAAALAFVNAMSRRASGSGEALPDAEVAIQAAAQAYEAQVNAAAATKRGNIAALSGQISDAVRQGGFATLGAWYQTFAQANTKLSDAVAAKAAVFGMSNEGDPAVTGTFIQAMTAYKTQQATTAYTGPLSTGATGDSAKGASATDSSKIIGSFFSAPGQRIVNALIDQNFGGEGAGQINPIIKAKNLGDYTSAAAETALATYAAAHALAQVKDQKTALGLLARVADTILSVGDSLLGALHALSPFLIAALVTLFVVGATLSTYLPLVPFIVWMSGVLSWLVAVGEAVIAAPLWAFAHLVSMGEGFGHRTAHGYTFLLNVMIRPVLMVVAFFFAGAVIVALGTLLNLLYGIAIANAQFDSITGLFSIILFLLIYLSIMLNMAHTAFNYVLIIPDAVISWVGGHASHSAGRDDGDRLRQTMLMLGNRLEQYGGRGMFNRPGSRGRGGSAGRNGIRS